MSSSEKKRLSHKPAKRLRNEPQINVIHTAADLLDHTLDAGLDETVNSFSEEYTLSDRDTKEFSIINLKPTSSAERYEVKSLLGHGGMSLVHKVLDTKIGREVALKRIDLNKKSSRLSFLIEGRVMSQLDHPGILPVYDFIETEDDAGNNELIGYTMRIASHASLYEAVILRGTIGIHELCHILRQVAEALEHAHNRGILHRDIKPHNILLGKEGEVYLTDWGVCALLPLHPDYKLLQRIRKNSLVGTPNYMAPEQALTDEDFLSTATDVYGLGATLYYCLTHRSPVKGSNLSEVLSLVATGTITPPHEVWASRGEVFPFPKSIEMICLKALSNQPADRYQSAREFAEALKKCSSGQLELERARTTAQDSYELGQEYIDLFQGLFNQGINITQEIKVLHRAHKRQKSDETRQRLWEAEEALDQTQISQEEWFSKAISALQIALKYDPEHQASRAALFSVYKERYAYSVFAKDKAMQILFEERLRLYASELELEQFDRPSEIILTGMPSSTHLTIFHHPIKRRQLKLMVHSTIDDYQGEIIYLPRGNFLVELSSPASVDVKIPLLLGSFQQLTIHTPLPKRESIPKGFKYISNGIAMSVYPVQAHEYYTFLNTLPSTEGDRRVPRYHQTAYASRSNNQRFELPYQDVEGDLWSSDWPILLINYHDALRYCEWRCEETGDRYRLPSSEEWLYASSGGDGRLYPWGDAFDSSLCIMRESHQKRPSPVSVGSAATDCSPFGIRDVAGVVCQWTSSPVEGIENHFLVVGAAYNSFEALCRLDQELVGHQNETFAHVGFRPVLELSKEDFLPAVIKNNH